jgi:hypothetical protein
LDERLTALCRWSADRLGSGYEIAPASADASFRRYFRARRDDRTYIVMDAPPDKEDMHPYVRIAIRFRALGLHVPEVFEIDHENGFFLLSDLGTRLYLPELCDETVERLYGDALGALAVLQTATVTEPGFLPEYSERILNFEMSLFRDWYLGRHLGLAPSDARNAVLDQTFALLTDSARTQPQVWVHRDYHSRNLLVARKNNPGIVDFQDALLGPVTYDLVSLLRDCYVAWPRPRVEEWALGFFELARQSGVPVGEDEIAFLRWFDLMGVQRHLKATGIFARLNHRDGKPGYLGDIPRTLGYAYEVSGRYPELAPFRALIEDLPDIRTWRETAAAR